MRSWRDSTPQAIQDDLDAVVNLALETAHDQVVKHGEFVPFGAGQDDDGLALTAGYDEAAGEPPESQVVLAAVLAGLQADRDRLRAAALVADVLAQGMTAIRVEAEHRDGGPALVVLLPYRVTRFRKRVEFGQASARTGLRQVWAD